jgi:hypothetical protein
MYHTLSGHGLGFFFKYANDLTGDERSLLAYYPFKWAYVPPHDSASAVDFLRDIGVEEDRATVEDVAAKFENMTSFELLEQEGSVQWGGDLRSAGPGEVQRRSSRRLSKRIARL